MLDRGSPVESLLQDVYPEHSIIAVGDVLRLLLPREGALFGLVPALLPLELLCLLLETFLNQVRHIHKTPAEVL